MNPSETPAPSTPDRVLVVGSINMDLVVRVKTLPGPGDTVLGSDVETFPGGKGANQAAAASRAGGRVAMLGKVGSDGYGRALRAALEEAGVDTALLGERPGPSGMAFITVDGKGENVIVVSSGANRHLKPQELSPEAFEGVAVTLMQLETPLETVTRAAELAAARGAAVILNAAPARPLEDALLSCLSCLVVNEGEAALLSGLEPEPGQPLTAFARQAAEQLLARGPAAVIATLGAEGVVWATRAGERGELPAHRVEVVDTTAAGDAFCGALATSLAEGVPLPEAVRFANAAGALAATRPGAQPSLPVREEIDGLLNRTT